MLYCKKCGNPVSNTDRFCEVCLSRLDSEDSILDSAQFAYQKLNGSINVEEIPVDTNLSCCEIFGYRITQKISTLFEYTYYRAVKENNNNIEERTIQYSVIKPDSFLLTELYNCKNHNQSILSIMKSYTEDYYQQFKKYNEFCSDNNIPNAYIDIKILYAESTQSYHIFKLMKKVTPFPALCNKYKVRDAISFAIDICKQIDICHKKSNVYSALCDINIFLGEDNAIYLGDKSLILNSKYCINLQTSIYLLPYNATNNNVKSYDLYCIAVFLYKFLNNNILPYQNYFNIDNSLDFYMSYKNNIKEGKDLQPPFFAQNALGNNLCKIITSNGCSYHSIEEFTAFLNNSIIFIPSEQLNQLIK